VGIYPKVYKENTR